MLSQGYPSFMILELCLIITSVILYKLYINTHKDDIPSISSLKWTIAFLFRFSAVKRNRFLYGKKPVPIEKIWFEGEWCIKVNDAVLCKDLFLKASN